MAIARDQLVSPLEAFNAQALKVRGSTRYKPSIYCICMVSNNRLWIKIGLQKVTPFHMSGKFHVPFYLHLNLFSFVFCFVPALYLYYFHSELDQVDPQSTPLPHHARTILEVLSYRSRLSLDTTMEKNRRGK